MAVIWTLKHDGVEKTLADWGVKNLSRRTRLEVLDTVAFFRPCRRMEADPLFEFDDTLQIFREDNGIKVQWFEGRVIDHPGQMSAQTEGQNYIVAGPGYWLENIIFKQIWKSYTGDKDNLAEVRLSRVLLGTKVVIDQIERQHMKDQIKEILDYAILCGAPFQYDVDAIPEIFLPTDELLDRYCYECIKPQLRLVPDLVMRWDYSVSPPKLIFKKRDDIVPVELTAFDGVKLDMLEIDECFDLRKDSVILRYEITNIDDGTTWGQHATEKVPANATGDELRAFMKTVNLQGFNRTTSHASLLSQSIIPNDPAWWKSHVTWLNDSKIESITMGEPTRSGELGLPYELIDGTFPPWLNDQDYSYELETIQVLVKVKFANKTVREEMLSVEVKATDADTGDYTNEDSFSAPEPIPVGLAQELYNAVNRREFKGTFPLVEKECSGLLVAGMTFNIPDGRPEWQTMKALVNEVVEEVDQGKSTVSFGPPPYLGLDDSIELLRQNRTRWVYTFTTRRATGKLLDSRIDLPSTSGGSSTGSGTLSHERLVVEKKTVDNLVGRIDADAEKTVINGVVRDIAPREMKVCVTNEDGTTEEQWVLGMFSETYKK